MKRALLAALVAASCVACATVQHGPMQRIRVDSDPSAATVRTEKCGPGSTKKTDTPGVVWVNRRAERCTLVFSAPGYAPARVTLARAIAPDFYQNTEIAAAVCDGGFCEDWPEFLLLGGIFAGTGFGVDAITGALYELHPNDVFVELTSIDDR